MPYLIAAVTFVGALSLVNLVLILALARRLRSADLVPRRDPRTIALAPGDSPASFTAVTAGGEIADRDSVRGGAVGFFSASCEPCLTQAPAFARYVREIGLPRSAVLAVLVGDEDQTAPLAALLEGAARLVAEPLEGPLYQAFSVRGLPAMVRLDAAGAAIASSATTAELPADRVAAKP